MPDDSKLRCVADHLEGDALQWHRAYLKTRNATVAEVPWADYVRSISARFSDAMFEDPMEEIASLVQLTDDAKGLQEYNSGFNRLLNKVTVSELYAVSLYLKGLKPEIKGPVKMFKPQTLREAYGLARIQTMNNTCLMKRFNAVEDGLQPEDVKITPPVNGSKLPLPSPTTEPSSSTPGIPRSRRLTSDELEQKRGKRGMFLVYRKVRSGAQV
ncbi:putative retrotransposon gag domain-containing protein [Helianthus annuus]|nr:putative retrotransposon gag domain-containing protein [Helianthus annuus]KAJ0873144.1 putative retrotransposon gag domain-containing protein [Helianthus annuus]